MRSIVLDTETTGLDIAEGHKIQDLLALVPNAKTMPQIWLDEEHIGGYKELQEKLNE